jgi:hypothetical protein
MAPELKEKLIKAGLKAAEDHIILALDEAIAIGELLVAETSNTIDDTVLSGIKLFKGQLKEAIDKLDGIDNQ